MNAYPTPDTLLERAILDELVLMREDSEAGRKQSAARHFCKAIALISTRHDVTRDGRGSKPSSLNASE